MYKKYKIIEIYEHQKAHSDFKFEAGQIIQGILHEKAEFVDDKSFRPDVIKVKGSDYFLYANQVEEIK